MPRDTILSMTFLRITPAIILSAFALLLACADDGSSPDEGAGEQGETADTGTGETTDDASEAADAGNDTDVDPEVLDMCETLCRDSAFSTCKALDPTYDPDKCISACTWFFPEVEAECTPKCYDAYLALYECLGAASAEDLDPDTCDVGSLFCAEPSGEQAMACGDCMVG